MNAEGLKLTIYHGERDRAALALGYAAASIAAGFAAVALATNLVRRARLAP